MASRSARIAIACWMATTLASSASANPFEWIWRVPQKVVSDIVRDTKRRNCWPEPFVQPDRQAAREPFGTMIEHGWRQQNLIAGYHFSEDGAGLNQAGDHKVRWILFEAPPQHRTIYVQVADDPQVTASRIDAVRLLAVQLSPHGDLPMVVATHIQPRGWPAEWVDSVGRKFSEATPAPVLPESGDSSSF